MLVAYASPGIHRVFPATGLSEKRDGPVDDFVDDTVEALFEHRG
jgi:hypothetical protein